MADFVLPKTTSVGHNAGMPKRISRKRPTDVNQLAHFLGDLSTREDTPATTEQISSFMAAMGSRGGKIGGKRRMFTMSAKARSTAARRAAKARWGGKTKKAAKTAPSRARLLMSSKRPAPMHESHSEGEQMFLKAFQKSYPGWVRDGLLKKPE
jgi:hypothetical protein